MTVGDVFNPYRLFTGIFIPEGIARLQDLGQTEKLVYGRLLRYAGEDGIAFPCVKTLGLEVGVNERQARRACAVLEEYNLIRRVQRRKDDGGLTSNQYLFLWHPCLDTAPRERSNVPAGVGASLTGGVGSIVTGKESHTEESQGEGTGAVAPPKKAKAFEPPKLQELERYFEALVRDARQHFPSWHPEVFPMASNFLGHYVKVGWVVRSSGKLKPMQDWKGAARQWCTRELNWWSKKTSRGS